MHIVNEEYWGRVKKQDTAREAGFVSYCDRVSVRVRASVKLEKKVLLQLRLLITPTAFVVVVFLAVEHNVRHIRRARCHRSCKRPS